MTQTLPVDDPAAREAAAACLREGGLVAFPTETVYGLGADALNPAAVARIFEVKQRPAFDPLIVHLSEASQVAAVAQPDPRVPALARRFWPGPLTLVLPRLPAVPDLVTAGLDTVGVRVPDHPGTRAWLAACGRPVAAPSANPFGYVSPTSAAHVLEQLGGRIEMVLDGGPCAVGVESTIVSLVEPVAVVLRPGAVLPEALREVLGEVVLRRGSESRPASPGRLERHYATRTPLRLLEPDEPAAPLASASSALLAFRAAPPGAVFGAVECLAPDGSLRTAGANLFAALRRLDGLGLERIIAEPVPEEGLGLAIMDRLRRCAAAG